MKDKSNIIVEQIKDFTPQVAEDIRGLAKQIGDNFRPLPDEDVQLMLQLSAIYLLVARDVKTNQIVGMLTLVIYRIPYVKKSSLEDLVVDEQHRGQGIGKILLEKALAIAREQQVAYIDFTSRPRRIASNTLYEKAGFKKRDTNVYRLILNYEEL